MGNKYPVVVVAKSELFISAHVKSGTADYLLVRCDGSFSDF